MSTERHLKRAREYVEKGDGFYARAADEIIAAQREDPTLGFGRIATAMGRSETWCRDIVKWRTNPQDQAVRPWAGPRGEKREASTAVKVLSSATPEQVEEIVRSLPRKDQEKMRAAAERVDWERRTPAEDRSHPGMTGEGERASKRARYRQGELVWLDFSQPLLEALHGLRDAAGVLRVDPVFSPDQIDLARTWLAQVRDSAELLEQALGGKDVDWDRALAQLEVE